MSKRKSKKISFSIIGLCILLIAGGVFAYFYFKNKTNDEVTIPNQTTNSYKINDDKSFIGDIWNLINDKVVTNKNSNSMSDYSYIRARVSDHAPVGIKLNINNNQYNVGHWNTLNFTFSKDKQEKVDNISRTILFYKFDLIGLTEINANTVTASSKSNANYFVNYINGLLTEQQKQTIEYDIIVSNNTSSKFADPGQTEQVAILYNKKKFVPASLTNLNAIQNDALVGEGYFYSNPLTSFDKDSSRQYDYVRSPFGTMFNLVDSTISYPITFLFSHFDSPGVSKNSTSKKTEIAIDGMGSQEYFEAHHIQDVMNEFKTKFNNDNIIFMGDTNIKLNKQASAFDEAKLSSSNYNFLFKDSSLYSTSLATVNTVDKYPNDRLRWYSNPYDKIIYSLKQN